MEEESKIPNVKQLIAVIFFGVPGIGKSTLIKKFLQDPEIDKYVIDIVSSDQIKAKCIKDFLEKNPSASQDEAFQKTAKPYRTDFISAIEKAVSKKIPQDKKHILFIDKIHPQNGVNLSVNSVLNCVDNSINVRIMGIYPQVSQCMSVSGQIFPFSFSTAISCIKRVANRTEHDTLTGEDKFKSTQIVLFFIKLHGNFKFFDPEVMNKLRIESLLGIPYTNEENELKIPDTLKDKIKNNLKGKPDIGVTPEKIPKLTELLSEITENDGLFTEEADISIGASLLKQHFTKEFSDMESNPSSNPKKPKKPKKSEKKQKKPKTKAASGSEEVKEHKKKKTEEAERGSSSIPMFIGIEAIDGRYSILETLRSVCEHSPAEYEEELASLHSAIKEQTIAKKGKGWKYPNSYHVTALFMGKDIKHKTNPIYVQFQEGVQINIRITCVVLVPKKIVFGICFFEDFEIGNNIPHMTMLVDGFTAKYSNIVGETLFYGEGPLSQLYKDGFFKQQGGEEYFKKFQITVQKQILDAFVVKLNPHLVLDAKTKCFY